MAPTQPIEMATVYLDFEDPRNTLSDPEADRNTSRARLPLSVVRRFISTAYRYCVPTPRRTPVVFPDAASGEVMMTMDFSEDDNSPHASFAGEPVRFPDGAIIDAFIATVRANAIPWGTVLPDGTDNYDDEWVFTLEDHRHIDEDDLPEGCDTKQEALAHYGRVFGIDDQIDAEAGLTRGFEPVSAPPGLIARLITSPQFLQAVVDGRRHAAAQARERARRRTRTPAAKPSRRGQQGR